MTAGLIVNPAAGKASGKGIALAELLRSSHSVPVHVLDEFSGLEQSLHAFAAAGVTDLFISSGDGTVQAIQTILAETSPFGFLPRLGLLAHGTTNMTAADLGVRIRSVAAQAAFIRTSQPKTIRSRHTLRVANPRDGQPRHGMFLGTGAVWRATKFCQQAIHKTGLKGNAASFATLATALLRSGLSRAAPDDETRIDRAYAMTVSNHGAVYAEGGQLLLLATTLNTLILNTRPFWGGADGPIRATILPYPVPSLVRWLIPLMYGGERRGVPDGAVSFSGSGFGIATQSPFVIDGEFFDPPAGEPLMIELGPAFDYICG